jgi:hypothetical protein
MLNASGCTAEIRAFVRGGTPGLARLKEVLPNVFSFYGIPTKYQQARVLMSCKLKPIQEGQHVTFEFKPEH